MHVVNLMGGPGVGKSVTAADLFARMKKLGLSVELSTEYAKDLVWEGREDALADQLYILAKQHRRLVRLQGKVEWVVTDAPLLLGLLYARPGYFQAFPPLVWEAWSRFENHVFHLTRTFEYRQEGRYQDEAGAKAVDRAVKGLLKANQVPHKRVPADGAADAILRHLKLVPQRSPRRALDGAASRASASSRSHGHNSDPLRAARD